MNTISCTLKLIYIATTNCKREHGERLAKEENIWWKIWECLGKILRI